MRLPQFEMKNVQGCPAAEKERDAEEEGTVDEKPSFLEIKKGLDEEEEAGPSFFFFVDVEEEESKENIR